jgi:integrase
MHQETQVPSDILKKLSQEQLIQLLNPLIQQQQSSNNQVNRITIDELCEKHQRIAEAREYADGTLKILRLAHENLREYAQQKGLIYADEVTYDHAEEFYVFLLKHKNDAYGKRKDAKPTLTRQTVIGRYKQVKAMFSIAEKRNHIYKNPFENRPYPQNAVTEWWDDDYVHNKLIPAVYSYKPKRGRTPGKKLIELKIRLTYTTGIRSGVILHQIKRKDVTIKGNKIVIDTKAKIPKSSKWQRHPAELLNEECKKMFNQYIEVLDKKGIHPDDYIFTSKKATPKSGYLSYRRQLTRICKQAGIPYLSPHKSKHGLITKLALSGMTSNKICKITGNRTPRLIDEVYTHIRQKDVRDEAYKALNSE